MTRIVVLGGYGLFGSRISQRLAADGRFQVIVGGRRPQQATGLIAECSCANPLPPRLMVHFPRHRPRPGRECSALTSRARW